MPIFSTRGIASNLKPKIKLVRDRQTGEARPFREGDPEIDIVEFAQDDTLGLARFRSEGTKNSIRNMLQRQKTLLSKEFREDPAILQRLNSERLRRFGLGRGSTQAGASPGQFSEITKAALPFDFESPFALLNPDFDFESLPDKVKNRVIGHPAGGLFGRDKGTARLLSSGGMFKLLEHLRSQRAESLKKRQAVNLQRQEIRSGLPGRRGTRSMSRADRLRFRGLEDEETVVGIFG